MKYHVCCLKSENKLIKSSVKKIGIVNKKVSVENILRVLKDVNAMKEMFCNPQQVKSCEFLKKERKYLFR